MYQSTTWLNFKWKVSCIIFKYKPLMSFKKYHRFVLNIMSLKYHRLMNIMPILIYSSLNSLLFVHGSLTVKQLTSTTIVFGYIFMSNSLLLQLRRRFKIKLSLKQPVLRKIRWKVKWYLPQILSLSNTALLHKNWKPSCKQYFIN